MRPSKTLPAVAVTALSMLMLGFAPRADNVKLVRAYAAGEGEAYSLKVTAKVGDDDIEASADIQVKVDKLLDGGKASLTCTVRNPKVLFGGAPTDVPIEPFVAYWDAMNMPDRLTTEGAEWMYTLLALSSILPGKDVEVGKEFALAWESRDKSGSVKGKGKVLEILERDGAKIARLQYDLSVLPDGEPEPATVKTTSEVRLDGGKLVKGEGTVSHVSEGLELKYSVASSQTGS